MEIKMQEAIEQFLDELRNMESPHLKDAEACLEMFADYLIYYSDLFQDSEEMDEETLEEWEAALEGYVEKLFDGDTEDAPDLGSMPLSMLDAEYIRDFLGWYLLREPQMDSLALDSFVAVLQTWLDFIAQKKWLDGLALMLLRESVREISSDASRAAKAAHLLLYYVRLGGGVSPRLRGKRFDAFVEGHARIEQMDLEHKHVFLGFDNQHEHIGPISLPLEIIHYLQQGDVLDVEMGQRGGQWIIVDIGPVYPASIYMEADELKIPDKLT